MDSTWWLVLGTCWGYRAGTMVLPWPRQSLHMSCMARGYGWLHKGNGKGRKPIVTILTKQSLQSSSPDTHSFPRLGPHPAPEITTRGKLCSNAGLWVLLPGPCPPQTGLTTLISVLSTPSYLDPNTLRQIILSLAGRHHRSIFYAQSLPIIISCQLPLKWKSGTWIPGQALPRLAGIALLTANTSV